jgi:hypothetical protein
MKGISVPCSLRSPLEKGGRLLDRHCRRRSKRRVDDRASLEIRRRRHSSYSDRTTCPDRPRARLRDRKRESSTERPGVEHERFPDDPDHFSRWLRASSHGGEDRFRFVPRLVYGRYLGSLIEDRLADSEAPRARWLRETVTSLSERDGSVTLGFSTGQTAVFDMAVLCCGHEASETLEAPFVSPWDDPSWWNAAPDSTILILGTGLTMVDAGIALSESGHRGAIVALSWRGFLPQAHRRVDVGKSRKRNCRRLRRPLLFCIGFARQRGMKC